MNFKNGFGIFLFFFKFNGYKILNQKKENRSKFYIYR